MVGFHDCRRSMATRPASRSSALRRAHTSTGSRCRVMAPGPMSRRLAWSSVPALSLWCPEHKRSESWGRCTSAFLHGAEACLGRSAEANMSSSEASVVAAMLCTQRYNWAVETMQSSATHVMISPGARALFIALAPRVVYMACSSRCFSTRHALTAMRAWAGSSSDHVLGQTRQCCRRGHKIRTDAPWSS